MKHGWVAVAVMLGIAVYFTHHFTEGDVDAKIYNATNYWGAELVKREFDISELKGEMADAKHDRDHYQEMLAPFEAYAIAKYTNAPLDQRLEFYGQTLSVITNELASDKPVIYLEINGTKITSFESPKPGEIMPTTPVLLNTNRQIVLHIFNDSMVTAEHLTIDFMADIDPTNVLSDQWFLEPPSSNGWNHWHLVATDSYGASQAWYPQTIIISQNFNQPILTAQFSIHADRSKTWGYSIKFMLQK